MSTAAPLPTAPAPGETSRAAIRDGKLAGAPTGSVCRCNDCGRDTAPPVGSAVRLFPDTLLTLCRPHFTGPDRGDACPYALRRLASYPEWVCPDGHQIAAGTADVYLFADPGRLVFDAPCDCGGTRFLVEPPYPPPTALVA